MRDDCSTLYAFTFSNIATQMGTMRFFSFKILFICILLPPVLYFLSLQFLERHLKTMYSGEIEDIYIGDTPSLLDGSIRLKDAVSENIASYLQGKPLTKMGVTPEITVITKQGSMLYPPVFEADEEAILPPDQTQIAARNYELMMNEGLVLKVDLKLHHDTLLSMSMLGIYVFLFLSVLYFYYRRGIRKARQSELEKNSEIERLQELEKTYNAKLENLAEDRRKLSTDAEKIRKLLSTEKAKASKNEDEMIEEIVSLEKKLEENLQLQTEQGGEIETLKEELRRIGKGSVRKEPKFKARELDAKRFRVLYKNLSVTDRAISGLMGLSDELKIKAEEVIHQLNENHDLVTIKRKVFGKKSRQTVLEVIFGYKGRLYFKKIKDGRVEILAVGSKNSQTKDLEYLDNLPPE